VCVLAVLSSIVTLGAGLGAQTPARDVIAKPTTGTATIAGTVVTDEQNSRPIRRVTVLLSIPGNAPSVPRVTATDDAGRFVFTRLPAGNYSAPRATRLGYVPVTYGEKRTGGIGTPITLAEGQQFMIAMKMLRGAVITGTVFDEGNRPAAQTSVRATQVRLVDGERTPVSSFNGTGGTTDDRGVYRIYGLPPGEYVVSATPRLQVSGDVRPITEDEIKWARQQLQPAGASPTAGAAPAGASVMPPKPGQAVAYTPVYYSGTTDAAAATLVTVTAGQERSGVDFGVQFVSTARISGTVVDQNGQPPSSAQINLVSRADSSMVMGDPFFMLDTMMMMRPTVVDGHFSLAGVRPGQYTLTARAAPRAGGPGSPAPAPAPANGAGRGALPPALTLWASTDVSVDGTDQSDIALRLQPGMTISGRIAFDGSVLQPPADLAKVTIRLTAAPNPSGVTVSVNVPSAPASADGTFKLEGVTPGRYFLSASAPAATPVPGSSWIVRSAMVGDVNAADRPFEVRPDEDIASAIISFTDKTAEISGTLQDAAGHPTPEFSIFLFPVDKAQWSQRSRRLRQPVRATTDGKFKFTNLLPGEYYMAALSDFEPNDYTKPAFLEQVTLSAIKITIAEGEKKVQDLKIAGGS
jgi:protocatechuate 3,4-dioxygenase beta subunit